MPTIKNEEEVIKSEISGIIFLRFPQRGYIIAIFKNGRTRKIPILGNEFTKARAYKWTRREVLNIPARSTLVNEDFFNKIFRFHSTIKHGLKIYKMKSTEERTVAFCFCHNISKLNTSYHNEVIPEKKTKIKDQMMNIISRLPTK